MIKTWTSTLTDEVRQPFALCVFCKTIFLYHIVKIFAAWPMSTVVSQYEDFAHPKAWVSIALFGLSNWASDHMTIFLIMFLVLLLAGIFMRLHIFLSAAIFWFALNYYRLHFSTANGSDLVLLELIFFTIPMSMAGLVFSSKWKPVQAIIVNGSLLVCQVHIAMLYFVSGYDKIISEAWRSGEAIRLIGQLDFMIRPDVSGHLPEGVTFYWIVAWATIVFEWLFPLLIWPRVTRWWMIAAGVIFHIAIGTFLSLPDFAVIMIVAYMVYVRDRDYARLPWMKKYIPAATPSS